MGRKFAYAPKKATIFHGRNLALVFGGSVFCALPEASVSSSSTDESETQVVNRD